MANPRQIASANYSTEAQSIAAPDKLTTRYDVVDQMPPARRNSALETSTQQSELAKAEAHHISSTHSDTSANAFTQAPHPQNTRLNKPNYRYHCQRESPQTGHLDKSKPVRDETQANQAAIVKFQMQHALSMHQVANDLIEKLNLGSEDTAFVLSDETLSTLAKRLTDFRASIRSAAHEAFQDQQLNLLSAKIDRQKSTDTLTLKGHATQLVMTALRNTLIDQGLTLIEEHLHRTTHINSALQAVFRLATAIELLEVTRFNPLLAYHDIDHTMGVVHGSMAIVAGTYDYAIQKAESEADKRLLKQAKPMALHKTMLFSAAHDSFFEFKPNTIIRNPGRREANSSEGLSARNLKKLLCNFAQRLDHPAIDAFLYSDEFSEDIDEAIFATVPTFTGNTVINGANMLASNLDAAPTNFVVRIATALADLEECLLPDTTRFISKSLLLNQEGSPVVDMSLIEHRSGVLLALSEKNDESLKNALADENTGAEFAEALDSWHRWMASQPHFARGRQQETRNLIARLIEHHIEMPKGNDELKNATDCVAQHDANTAEHILCLEGLIHTLLNRYARLVAENDVIDYSQNSRTNSVTENENNLSTVPVPTTPTLTWRDGCYHINQAGARAAEQVVRELEGQRGQALNREEQLFALAQVLRRNLPPEVNRLTIPRAESFSNLNGGSLKLITEEVTNASSTRIKQTRRSEKAIDS